MPARTSKAGPLILGMIAGLLIGWIATVALTDREPVPTREGAENAAKPPPKAHGKDQHERPPGKDPHSGGEAKSPHGAGAGADRAQASFAKVHFMKKFLDALKTTPQNKWPLASYRPLLKGGEALSCGDCHDPSKVDMEGMLRIDPGREAVEAFRKNPTFMIPLMQKWVARLNKDHAERLRKKVTCVDCHAISPIEAWKSLPPLMVRFVNALKNEPTNKQPASRWKPLLKSPGTASMLCATCHGEIGEVMERQAPMFRQAPRPAIADDRAFMVQLMERWVERLNRDAKEQLVKPVTCLDCHETDPKR